MKTKLKFIQGQVNIKAEENKITVIASDETLDRHGDVLPVEAWDLTKFRTAPRMLVDHNHEVSSIVGKWENPRIEGDKLLMDANFHGITDLSKAVLEMVRQGYLNTVSVGFIPHGPTEDGGRETLELIETSWVTVPANPNARITATASLKELLEKQNKDADAQKVIEFMGKDAEDEPSPEEIEEGMVSDESEEPVEGEESEDDAEDKEEVSLEELGYVLCNNVEEFNNWIKGSDARHSVVCSTEWIKSLIADSVALNEITAAGKRAKKASQDAELIKLSIREAATLINKSLRELNNAVK